MFLKQQYRACIILIAVATPRVNGQVERMNRFLTPMLAKLSNNRKMGSSDLAEFSINNTVCRSIGNTPSQLLFIEQLGQ